MVFNVQCNLYNLCFFLYVWIVPVFLQFLMRAPSTFDSAPFYPVPMRTLNGDVAHLEMSSFPQTTAAGVAHCRPCHEDKHNRVGMYQWDIMLSMSHQDLIHHTSDKQVSTMYPVVFVSDDFRSWRVVADAADVAGPDRNIHKTEGKDGKDEPTHISAPLLVANLKDFGCVNNETAVTDPFMYHFDDKEEARGYKWRLVEHVSIHGSVNLVACVMHGMENVNHLIHHYVHHCRSKDSLGGEMKCHLSAQQALGQCFALGSACGMACGLFAPDSRDCIGGKVNPDIFKGLTHRRVTIKTKVGGGGDGDALRNCDRCHSGMTFKDMYVEADNPIEFFDAEKELNTRAGGFYLVMLAMSNRNEQMEFSLRAEEKPSSDEKEDEDDDDDDRDAHRWRHRRRRHHHHNEGRHRRRRHHHHDREDIGDLRDGSKDDDDDDHKRACVHLPGVRLSEVPNTALQAGASGTVGWSHSPQGCEAQCRRRDECAQSIYSNGNGECYLFRMASLAVVEFADIYNSSYCSDKEAMPLLMTMVHKAYSAHPLGVQSPMAFARRLAPPPWDPLSDQSWNASNRDSERRLPAVPDLPKAKPPKPPKVGAMPPKLNLSSEPFEQRFFWQIAHVPNLTMGVFKDQGSTTVRVIPRNESCFTTPGFVYMVACMTAKPVFMNGHHWKLQPPPFNDRCLAVGGLCGATCGSSEEPNSKAAAHCPLEAVRGNEQRNLRAHFSHTSPYALSQIPFESVVEPISPKKSSNQHSAAARMFFHLFVFFVTISYVATILGRFPGNFADFYPMHTWDEIKTHGYLLEKFGCAASCGCSSAEHKMVILRNWIGKIAARPHFDDDAFPTFSRWVDMFADEGHREGARILWVAWCNFLDTSPPVDFLEQWSDNLRMVTWDQSIRRSPFDVVWEDRDEARSVLPVIVEQATVFGFNVGAEGGVRLELDSLTKLLELRNTYKALPDNLKMEPSLPRWDDCILTREVNLSLRPGAGIRPSVTYDIKFEKKWPEAVHKKVKERSSLLGMTANEYESTVVVTDKDGNRVSLFGSKSQPGFVSMTGPGLEGKFPLRVKEPPDRAKDRKVIMIYVARARPESERKGIEKTRVLDKYLWANLRPDALSHHSPEETLHTGNGDARELAPLLAPRNKRGSAALGRDADFRQIRRNVQALVERQNAKFLDSLAARKDIASKTGLNYAQHRTFVEDYLQYRKVDSDWEVGRFCYGEIVAEEKDEAGDEVLILDNPSPALLELITDYQNEDCGSAAATARRGMGLVSLDTVPKQETWCCFPHEMNRVTYAPSSSLEFRFTDTGSVRGTKVENRPADIEREFRNKLKQHLRPDDVGKLKVIQRHIGKNLLLTVNGPGRAIEELRDINLRGIQLLHFRGRMMDNHPTVIVKKSLLMPYSGVRGKGGGLNFCVDLLQFRQGFIGTGDDSSDVPERMLFGIFDARHQPHKDFWRMCLPKFMKNKEIGFSYEANNDICMVQAPQSFAGLNMNEDILDINNGMCFNIMNIIRNRCGGVTSCGTNAVWQVNSREFNRQHPSSVTKEYFDSRTKIEDTASTHIHFCNGKRSVYVHEKVSTGIAKVNNDYLCAVQRWAEGAVQLFWLQLFVDKNRQLVTFGGLLISLILFIYYMLYGGWTKELIGVNLFCDAQGGYTLFWGSSYFLCSNLYELFSSFLGHTIDKIIFQMAEEDYMRLIDISITWLFICLFLAAITIVLAWKGRMPRFVRLFVMYENITYFWTSCSMFFWFSLTLFMITGMDPPLRVNVTHFMIFILTMNITQHTMINHYKTLGECDELSIWRSHQSYTISTPLYIMAILQGTKSAWGIAWRHLDKSFWTASDHGQEVIRGVTVWITLIWISFFFCVGYTILMYWHGVPDNIAQNCQLGGLFMLLLLALTVWEPFLTVWGLDKYLDTWSKEANRIEIRALASLSIWWRGKAWIIRYILDFGLPLLILSGATGGVSMLQVAAYATTVQVGRT